MLRSGNASGCVGGNDEPVVGDETEHRDRDRIGGAPAVRDLQHRGAGRDGEQHGDHVRVGDGQHHRDEQERHGAGDGRESDLGADGDPARAP